MIMKKSLALAAVLGVATLLATPVVGNAAAVTDGGTTTAKVGLTEDPDNNTVKLTNAPNVDFGSDAIGAKELNLPAMTVDDPITVENPGLADGWTVQVAGTSFVNGSTTLKGAKFNFTKGAITSEDPNNQSGDPTGKDVKVSDDATTIFSADKGAGIGTWSSTYATSNVTLDIPAGNVAGDYTSTLTWTLVNTPA